MILTMLPHPYNVIAGISHIKLYTSAQLRYWASFLIEYQICLEKSSSSEILFINRTQWAQASIDGYTQGFSETIFWELKVSGRFSGPISGVWDLGAGLQALSFRR